MENPTAGVAYEAANGLDNGCVDGGVDCTPPEMAANDILAWLDQATDTLPGAGVQIDFDDTVVPNTYEITVSWVEPGMDPAEPTPDYTIEIPVLAF